MQNFIRPVIASIVLLYAVGGCVETVAEDAAEPAITVDDRDHWSFHPLSFSSVPPLPKQSGQCETVIDRFIAFRQVSKGLEFSPLASRRQLIRRLTFDLTGLPPTESAIQNYLSDKQIGGYERLVERLLSSPAYGEHQSQFWLDLARFAETDGYEHDKIRPEAWRYRDWVIRAMNDDMPYDQFVRAQIAGDLESDSGQIATSFCLSGPDMPDINSQEERRHILLNEMTSTVGAVFLGLQVGCAQCHDHKYDPFSQADFYRLRSFFNSSVSVVKNKSVSTLSERTKDVPKSFLMIRGSWSRPGAEVSPAFPRVLLRSATTPKTNRSRLDLANWITSDDNPIAARVIVNRVWQQHFGRGLSDMPSDFGLIGNEPTHIDLLDWLAAELIRGNWSIKSLRRLIVTSTTYRQNSVASNEGDKSNRWYTRYPRRRLTGEQIRDAMLTISGQLNSKKFGPGVRPPLPPELTKTLLNNQWKVTADKSEHVRRSVYIFARRNLRYPIFDAFDRPDANSSCSARSKSTTAPQSLLLFNSTFSLSTARRFAGRLNDSPRADRVAKAVELAWGRPVGEDELAVLQKFLTDQTGLIKAEQRPIENLAMPVPADDRSQPAEQAALVDLCLALMNANEFIYYD